MNRRWVAYGVQETVRAHVECHSETHFLKCQTLRAFQAATKHNSTLARALLNSKGKGLPSKADLVNGMADGHEEEDSPTWKTV